MTHATLQIQTDFHYSLRGKILVIVKDSSGKPIFLCSLAPKKERLRGANIPRDASSPTLGGGGYTRGAIAPRKRRVTRRSFARGTKFGKTSFPPTAVASPSLATRATAILSTSDAKKQKNPVRGALAPHSVHSAQLLGFKLGQACIFKGIHSVDVVIQEHSGPTSLLLQGLRMGGVRFNRFRVFNAADRSEDLKNADRTRWLSASLPPTKVEQLGSKKGGATAPPIKEFLKFLRILTKSRLIKKSTNAKLTARADGGAKQEAIAPLAQAPRFSHHQLKQAKALKFKINKILYRKRRRKAIRKTQLTFLRGVRRRVVGLAPKSRITSLEEAKQKQTSLKAKPLSFHALFPLRVTSPFTQKKAVAFLNTPQPRSKKQNLLQLTPSYHLRRSLAAFVSTSIQLSRAGKIVQGSKRQVQRIVRDVMPKQRIPPTKTKESKGWNTVERSKKRAERFFSFGGGVAPTKWTLLFGGREPQRGYRLPNGVGAVARLPSSSPALRWKKLRSRHLNSKRKKLSKARAQRLQTRYIANVQNTLNNTIITITNRSGNTKLWCSSGSIGLKASRRSTNYAAQSVAEAVAKKCRRLGIRRVEVKIQGVGYGKASALKGLRIGGLKIKRIIDTTPKAHNGCRAPKKRRV